MPMSGELKRKDALLEHPFYCSNQLYRAVSFFTIDKRTFLTL